MEYLWLLVNGVGWIVFLAGWLTTFIFWMSFQPTKWPVWAYGLSLALISGGFLVIWVSAGALVEGFPS